jgi:hypothetical protein
MSMTAHEWRIEAARFLLPKEGQTLAECEDAVGVNVGARVFAVADGATEAFDARRWAARLVCEWTREAAAPVELESFRAWLAEQGERFQAAWGVEQLAWYAEEKRSAGSFAAFVGLRFETDAVGALRWRAVALGDSCLAQMRGGQIVAALPIESHESFNWMPPLAPTAGALREAALKRAVFRAGRAEVGDVFFLLTDAVAAWFLQSHAEGRARVKEFDSLAASSENEALAELLRGERRAGRLKDDDVAVIRLAVVNV